jgi:hypothetical protein
MCINQRDPKEKSRPVPRMGEMYRKSWCVVNWLGDATAGSDEAFDFINEVYEARGRVLTRRLSSWNTCQLVTSMYSMGKPEGRYISTVLSSPVDHAGTSDELRPKSGPVR